MGLHSARVKPVIFPLLGNGEEKGGAPAFLRFHPEAAAMTFHNFLADGQPDAGAGILRPAVQALKNHEDALLVSRSDADAVVPDCKPPGAVVFLGRDLDNRRLLAAKLEGIGEEILEELDELNFIALNGGQGSRTDLRAALLKSG
jgi:hypothetical protein